MVVMGDGIPSRNLRERAESTSATFPGCLFVFIGATGTGSVATSTACGATGSGLVATSGTFAGCTAVQRECRPCNQAGDAKTRQDLFQFVKVHCCLLNP